MIDTTRTSSKSHEDELNALQDTTNLETTTIHERKNTLNEDLSTLLPKIPTSCIQEEIVPMEKQTSQNEIHTPIQDKKLKRKSISIAMKKQAIEWISGPGKGIPSRAEKHFRSLNWDISASSFRKWWKNREKIMQDSDQKKRISGGGRKPYLETDEEKLLVLVIQERAKKDRVTRRWIAKTAQQMYQRNGIAFKASENWVTKFIRRNQLTLRRSYVTYEGPLDMENHTNTIQDISNDTNTNTTEAMEMDSIGTLQNVSTNTSDSTKIMKDMTAVNI